MKTIADVISCVATAISLISLFYLRRSVRQAKARTRCGGGFEVPGGFIRPGRQMTDQEIAEFKRRWDEVRP